MKEAKKQWDGKKLQEEELKFLLQNKKDTNIDLNQQITNGKPVVINTDGTAGVPFSAQTIYNEALSYTNTIATNGSGTFVILWVGTAPAYQGYVVAGTISGNTVTLGTPVLYVSEGNIADDAVTYAKIQNVSATNKILGRNSSGAGVIEELSPSDAVSRELILATVNLTEGSEDNIMREIESFDANVLSVGDKKIMVSLSGPPDVINEFETVLEKYGIVGVQRTGIVALATIAQ